jgi:hypothetical protein
MNQNQNPDPNYISPLWESIVRIYKILSVTGISIIMIFMSWFALFKVAQVTDSIIALGNFGSPHHFIIFSLISVMWAFFIWYSARVFYYIEYRKRTDVKDYEKVIITHTPRVLGASALLIIGTAFLVQAPQCQNGDENNPIRNIGIFLVILAFIFLLFINLRRKIFHIKPLGELHDSLQSKKSIIPVNNLPGPTQKIITGATIIVILLLVALIIWPIQLTVYLGDGVTVLIGCLCIWLPLLYWVRYFSLKLGFPLFLLLAVMIAVFSFFNGNANVRLVNASANQGMNIDEYYGKWIKGLNTVSQSVEGSNDQRTPMVIVLSEGGGIRATYWSAQLMSRIQKEYPRFRDYLFCISGVSGGSFGATIFDGLLDYYDRHPDSTDLKQPDKSAMQQKITDIAGKDFLSPTIACMFTREAVRLLVPFPIESFDSAKVFEETWEDAWRNNLQGDTAFSEPFLSLWRNNTKSIPAVFLNTTQVENGYPIFVSHLRLQTEKIGKRGFTSADISPDLHLPRDFYSDILNNVSGDVRISTASHLSARFPYVSPAGTLTGKDGNNIGLVDGGYFDNIGANTAYQVLFYLWYHNVTDYQTSIKPVIVYIKNGLRTPDEKASGRTMLYQLIAPLDTMMQVRDANTNNNLLKLKEFVEFYQGEFITCSLQDGNNDPANIPLGWALSRKAQVDIDNQVKNISIGGLGKYLK